MAKIVAVVAMATMGKMVKTEKMAKTEKMVDFSEAMEETEGMVVEEVMEDFTVAMGSRSPAFNPADFYPV